MKSFAVLVFLTACAGDGNEPQQHLPRPTNPTFTLLLSNQSFDLPTVDMTVKLDGQLAVDGDFHVEGQHTWIPFDFGITPGSHTLEVTSNAGATTLSQTFVMDDRKWATVMFWYYQAGSPEPTPKHFSFQLSDEQPLFD